MPLQATSGAASYDAFGGGAAAVIPYVEDVFSTHLYTGNGSTQTINNGVDLAGKGGLAWIKNRATTGTDHFLFDTNRGALNEINTNSTAAQVSLANSLTSFNANGFSIGSAAGVNANAGNYVSWTFRKQPKFFDVVTYTGNGSNRTIAHSLNSVPGMILVKRTDTTSNWPMWHKSVYSGSNSEYLTFQSQANPTSDSTVWTTTAPTSTVFRVGTSALTNASGGTYVAYVFADSNAGGFGLLSTDSVIACGLISGSSSDVYVSANLGWEPELILFKQVSGTGGPPEWILVDNKRRLLGTSTNVESFNLNPAGNHIDDGVYGLSINATGFTIQSGSGSFGTFSSYVYMAIRRGPMKVPTTGTSVFAPNNTLVNSGPTKISTTFPVDLVMTKGSLSFSVFDRLRGAGRVVNTGATNSEVGLTASNWQLDFMDGFEVNSNDIDPAKPHYAFRRAPGFFDVVCYTGNNTSNRAVNHSLNAIPGFLIVKKRSGEQNWAVWSSTFTTGDHMYLNTTGAVVNNTVVFGTNANTSTTFNINLFINDSGGTYVAYLFATCPGVSKVGSYTGNGSSQTINCGFTGGARFVLIKRTDSTGDWYVWDTARGIVAGNDPHLSLNTTVAEVTSNDTIDTDSTGFVVNQVAATNVNVNAATYIFLAIA